MSETTFIYSLSDPNTGDIRYIGKADDPFDRLRFHLLDRHRNHRTNWIRSLASIGFRPVVDLVAEVPAGEWEHWEREYIQACRRLGFDLTNQTSGGGGRWATPHSEKTKALMRAARNAKCSTGNKATASSKFWGVIWSKRRCKWESRITVCGHRFNLGYYDSEVDACTAREWVSSLFVVDRK